MTPDVPGITPEAMALAEEAAAKDGELLAQLTAAREKVTENRVIPNVEATPRRVMNRADRRAQVQAYARILAMTERQEPVVNPTIIPKSARRRRKTRNR
jgi:hypothetical protein